MGAAIARIDVLLVMTNPDVHMDPEFDAGYMSDKRSYTSSRSLPCGACAALLTTVDFVPRRPRLIDCTSPSSHCISLASLPLMLYSLRCQIFSGSSSLVAKFSILSEPASSIRMPCLPWCLRFRSVLVGVYFKLCVRFVRRRLLAKLPNASRSRSFRRRG